MSNKENNDFAQSMKDLLSATAPSPTAKADSPATKETSKTTPKSEPTPAQRSYAQLLPVRTVEPTDEVTIISPGTKIVGDISTNGSLQIGGDIRGNITVASTLELAGRVIGNIEAEDITISSSAVRGDIAARNSIHMDKDTTVIGDVITKTAEINGKIRGNMTVIDRAHIEADSVLVGNLVSGTVNIEDGAMLKGDVSILNAVVEEEAPLDLDAIFDIDMDDFT